MLATAAGADGVAEAGGTDLIEIKGIFVEGGVECPLFRADDGRGFALTGLDRSAATIGAKATLWGREVQFSTCQQGPTLAVDHIELDNQPDD